MVKRYKLHGYRQEQDGGEFVLHFDYATLEKERDMLVEALEKASNNIMGSRPLIFIQGDLQAALAKVRGEG